MRLELWALQDVERLLEEARLRLPRRPAGSSAQETRQLLQGVHRALVSHLSGATVHPEPLQELRASHGAASLVAAAQGIAAALRERAARAIPDEEPATLQQARLAITEALDELLARFDDELPLDIEVTVPRPTVVTALAELAVRPPTAEAPGAQSLLRVRACSAAATLALEKARPAILNATGLPPQPSAPDELLLGSAEPGGEGVLRLVRAAGQVVAALGAHGVELRAAIVAIEGDPLAALVRAAALPKKDGLLFLDESSWQLAGAALVAVPGVTASSGARAVDPAAAFGNERWELSALLQRPPFLGRDALVQRVASLLRDDAGGATLALVHGAPGAGKASLLRAALAEAGLQEGAPAILWGAADLHDHTPYAPVVAMLRALAGAPIGHGRAPERLARLVEQLAGALPAEDAGELTRLLPVLHLLLGHEEESGAALVERSTEELSPRVLRSAVRRALLLVLCALRARAGDGRPAVVVVSGADKLDGATRDALAFAAARLGHGLRVVLLSSARLRLAASFEACFHLHRLELQGLPPEEARELLAACFDRAPDDAELAPFVEKARGSPLALLQMVRLGIEAGLITKSGERWFLADFASQRVPARLERLLAARLERLPQDTLRLLSVCAQLGPALAPAAAEFVGVRLGMSRDEVGRSLALLVDAGFLVRQGHRPGAPLVPIDVAEAAPLSFEHPLLREAALSLVGDAEAASAAALVADALEATVTTGVRALGPRLAQLHARAGRPAAALKHLGAAVRRSARLDDRQGAVAMAREGLALAGEDALAAFPFHLELEAVRRGSSRSQEREAQAQLAAAAARTGLPRHRALAEVRAARFALFCGDEAAAEAAARRALAELQGAPDARLQPQALRLLALARFRRRDLVEASTCVVEARRQTSAQDARGLAALDHLAGLMALERGDPAQAVELLLAAREQRRRAADVEGECACLDAVADAFARTGRLATALALLEEIDRLRERIGDELGRAWSRRSSAEALLAVGDAEAALRLALDARQLAAAHHLDRLDLAAAVLAARAYLQSGATAFAEAELDSVRRRARDPFSAMEVAAWTARARLARASSAAGAARERALRGALARAREAVRLGEEHGWLSGQVLGLATIGQVMLQEGDCGQALAFTQRAAELLDERTATTVPVEDVLGAFVSALRALGDDEEAETARRRARQLLEERAARLPAAARERFWSLPARRALQEPPPPSPMG